MKKIGVLSGLLLLPLTAAAHPGHEMTGFVSGFLHPFSGLDHLLMLLALGFWTARQMQNNQIATAISFIGCMVMGFVLAAVLSMSISWLEMGLAMSLIAMAVMLLLMSHLPRKIQLGLGAVFACLHGIAHGQELLLSSAALIGTLTASTLIVFSGFWFAKHIPSSSFKSVAVFSALLSTAGAVMIAS